MNGAPFRAIGGAIVADHGAIALAQARALARFYAGEAHALPGGSRAAKLCAGRARALTEAADQAWLWRRAAGWARPEAADEGPIRA